MFLNIIMICKEENEVAKVILKKIYFLLNTISFICIKKRGALRFPFSVSGSLGYVTSHDPPEQASSPERSVLSSVSITFDKSTVSSDLTISLNLVLVMSSNGA